MVWRRTPQGWVSVGLGAGGVLVGWRLLAGTFTLFEHAYLSSYWAVPGSQVSASYWKAVRFAFGETVLVALGVGVLASLTVIELDRAVRR